MAKIPDYVDVITLDSGTKRYEVRADITAPDSPTGRRQARRRFKTLREATTFYAETSADRSRKTSVAPSKVTVQRAIEEYLDALELAPNSITTYTDQLRPAVSVLGDKPVQNVRRTDIEKLMRDLRKGGVPSSEWRKPMKRPKSVRATTPALGARSVNRTLSRLNAVWNRLLEEGTVTRNIPATVKPHPIEDRTERETLTVAQVEKLYQAVKDDRLEHLHHLALHGLRRGELSGLLWEDIDLDADAPTLTVCRQRVPTRLAGVITDDPKTVNSGRVLPVPTTLLPVLKRARTRARLEKLAAGSMWVGTGHVIVNEFGRSYHPHTLKDFWHKALEDAELPRVRLHDARHTCGTLMHLNGVPISVISAWLGHSNAAFTQQTYAHSQPDALRLGAELYGSLTAQ